MFGWYKKSTFKVKYCESDIVSTRFRQIEKLQIVKHFPCTDRGRVDRWVCNHRSRPGASFITVICMRLFIFVPVRHRFQCLVALVSLCDSTHC